MKPILSIPEINNKKPLGCLLICLKYLPSKREGKQSVLRVILCKCACGKELPVFLKYFLNGDKKSCGCSYNGKTKKPKYIPTGNRAKRNVNYKRGQIIRDIYMCYYNMINRCYNQRHESYIRYGARGVTVCDEWRSNYLSFQKWAISNGWEKGLQLDKDKIGTGKLYSPENCCWLTPFENTTLKCARYEYNGFLYTLSQISKLENIKIGRLYKYLSDGLTLTDSISKAKTKIKRGRTKQPQT